MPTRKSFLYILILFLILLPMNLWADGTKVEKIRVIQPGEAERCATDFFVDNIGDDAADLKVVLGHKVYVDEMLAAGEKRAFDLPATIKVAQARGQVVTFDDVAVIINLGPKSHMRVRCIDVRENPLHGKDPLAVFK